MKVLGTFLKENVHMHVIDLPLPHESQKYKKCLFLSFSKFCLTQPSTHQLVEEIKVQLIVGGSFSFFLAIHLRPSRKPGLEILGRDSGVWSGTLGFCLSLRGAGDTVCGL